MSKEVSLAIDIDSENLDILNEIIDLTAKCRVSETDEIVLTALSAGVPINQISLFTFLPHYHHGVRIGDHLEYVQ